MPAYTPAEVMVVAAAREIHDYDVAFVAATKEMYLQSTHPGVSVAEVQAATGWELRLADDLHDTPAPQAEELRLLQQFDPEGFWTRA